MAEFFFKNATKAEIEPIEKGLEECCAKNLPFTQDKPFIDIRRCVKDTTGDVVGGGIAWIMMWGLMYVDSLWVRDDMRGDGLGSRVLADLEAQGKKQGAKLVYLDTFDFQARGFYEKQGYSLFGTLDGAPDGHKKYFLSKKI